MKIANKAEIIDEDDFPYFSVGYFPSLIVNFILVCTFCVIAMWWHIPKNNHPHWIWVLGLTVLIIILLVLIIIGTYKLCEKIVSRKVKRPNILKEFIKAKYHKYCPKIEWEENEQL